jgi:hypothetical protein
VDADESEYRALLAKYKSVQAVEVVKARVTRDNVNSLLRDARVPPDVDVLSIDIDGNDYWVWDALVDYSPRAVIIEFNAAIDQERQLVQPYQPDKAWDHTNFFGASLGALRRLGAAKGYALVHVDLSGVNAFFIRTELAGAFDQSQVHSRPFNLSLSGIRHPEPQSMGGHYVDVESGP